MPTLAGSVTRRTVAVVRPFALLAVNVYTCAPTAAGVIVTFLFVNAVPEIVPTPWSTASAVAFATSQFSSFVSPNRL